MLLTTTSRKLAGLPHSDALILRLQTEYEMLLKKINEFSLAKKQWIKASKASVMEGYDLEDLKQKVEKLKANFLCQKKSWLMLNAKIA